MHGVYLIRPQCTIKADNKGKKTSGLQVMSQEQSAAFSMSEARRLLHSSLSASRHTGPLLLQVSSVLLCTQWWHGLGFLAHCFHWVSITWGLSLAPSDCLSLQRPRIWTGQILITAKLCNMTPVRKPPSFLAQAETRVQIDWLLLLIHVYPSVIHLRLCPPLCQHGALHDYLSACLMLQLIRGCLLLITPPVTLSSVITFALLSMSAWEGHKINWDYR